MVLDSEKAEVIAASLSHQEMFRGDCNYPYFTPDECKRYNNRVYSTYCTLFEGEPSIGMNDRESYEQLKKPLM